MAWSSLVYFLAIVAVALGQGKKLASLVQDYNEQQGKAAAGANSDVTDEKIQEIWGSFGQDSTSEPAKSSTTSTTTARVPDLNPNAGIPGTGECNCVPFYLCNNGTVNTNGEGIIDIRVNDGPCESYLDVCCNPKDVTKEPKPTPRPPKTKGCGQRNEDGVGFRITGADSEAQFGEFPWMLAVMKEEPIEGSDEKLSVYQCGGALIHPQVALTAAHCVFGKKTSFKVRAGEWDTQYQKEVLPHQERQVVSMEVHAQYYAGALYNDVALLFLDSPFTIADNVDVVCLPPKGAISDSKRCFATGWGKDLFGKEGKYQVILKRIELPVVNRQTCQDKLRTTRLGKYFELHASFICAGGEPGKDTCKGDGGSPLVCPIDGTDNQYYQAGIVAWGIGCGENQVPGVYVNVAQFRDWIDDKMRAHNYQTSSYHY